jgi:hypothetical protein
VIIGTEVGQYKEAGIRGYYHRIDMVQGALTFYSVHPTAKLVDGALVAIDAAEGERAFLTRGRKAR